ncbi:MAG TPA: hypothetical protein PK711_13825, partial [Bacteroidales bacterium]|nr:hypothetical protein [Bacteroidales bacterium]
ALHNYQLWRSNLGKRTEASRYSRDKLRAEGAFQLRSHNAAIRPGSKKYRKVVPIAKNYFL